MRVFQLYNRDGYHLQLKEVAPHTWILDFNDYPEWGNIGITGGTRNEDGSRYDILAIDPMGGPYLGIGYVIDDTERVYKITAEKLGPFIFHTKTIEKEEQKNDD